MAIGHLAMPKQANFAKHASSVANDILPRLYGQGSLAFTCLYISFTEINVLESRGKSPTQGELEVKVLIISRSFSSGIWD